MNTNRNANRVGTVDRHRKTAAIHLVQSSRFSRRLANWLIVGLFASILAMAFLPWQQTSRSSGQVLAMDPQERQQAVQAQTEGVVSQVKAGLREGMPVKRGDVILVIEPFASGLVAQLGFKLENLQTKEATANTKASAYGDNVKTFTEALAFTINMANEKIESAKSKLKSKQEQISGYEAKVLQARLNYERQNRLYQKGLKPAKEIEKFKKDFDVAQADLEELHEIIASLERDVKAEQEGLEKNRREAQSKIDYAKAMQQDALGEAATAQKEMADVRIKLEEVGRMEIEAPKDGVIYRLQVNEKGDAVKKGDVLFTIVPEVTEVAVELFVNGNDMPLVELGQEVRLQFEGWPAVQFPGWPSIAVGTFSGTVTTIDSTDNGKGQFRILATPTVGTQTWPSDRFLKQGVRANGWVMIKQVKLGYEIWRQLNGFPIIVSDKEPEKDGVPKVPKLPK